MGRTKPLTVDIFKILFTLAAFTAAFLFSPSASAGEKDEVEAFMKEISLLNLTYHNTDALVTEMFRQADSSHEKVKIMKGMVDAAENIKGKIDKLRAPYRCKKYKRQLTQIYDLWVEMANLNLELAKASSESQMKQILEEFKEKAEDAEALTEDSKKEYNQIIKEFGLEL